MEAALLILNGIVVAIAIIMSLRDEGRPAGRPATSVFRSTELPTEAPADGDPAAPAAAADWRSRTAPPPLRVLAEPRSPIPRRRLRPNPRSA